MRLTNKTKRIYTNKGHTMMELLFYISFFILFSLIVINSLINMAGSFRETTVYAEFLESGNIVERIAREIRQANSISAISSTDLVLNSTDSGGTAKTVEIVLSGSNIQFLENGSLVGNLNTANTSVTALTFTQITTTQGAAIKIAITVQSSSDKLGRAITFYNTIGLRGSY